MTLIIKHSPLPLSVPAHRSQSASGRLPAKTPFELQVRRIDFGLTLRFPGGIAGLAWRMMSALSALVSTL